MGDGVAGSRSLVWVFVGWRLGYDDIEDEICSRLPPHGIIFVKCKIDAFSQCVLWFTILFFDRNYSIIVQRLTINTVQ